MKSSARCGRMATIMKFLRVSLCVLQFVLWASLAAFDQDTGQITSIVRDSSRAILPGAKVTVSNKSPGLDRPTVTNSSGEYLAAGLPQSKYDISVTAPRFKEHVVHEVVLDAAQELPVDVTLEAGTISERVVVSGEDKEAPGNGRTAP